ncbi:MAG: diaminopimelate epimerase [Verrucomicrobiota bacterium]
MLSFTKMNGAGNDFVVIDNREKSLALTQAQIARLCERQRGIGADGLLLVEPAENGADHRMRYYNADGGEAEMCGNGARCFARFVNQLAGGGLDSTSFETIAGVIGADFIGDQVRLAMSEPFDLKIGAELSIDGEATTVHSVNTGVPHAVVFVEDLASTEVNRLGAAIRFHDHFAPAGTNANFVEVIGPSSIAIRTYERGVEAETLACGTGMVACALIHHQLTDAASPVSVKVAGGDTLEIGFEPGDDGQYSAVTLLGPADFTFSGTLTESL